MCSCGQCAVSTAKVVVHINSYLILPYLRPTPSSTQATFLCIVGLKGAKEVVVGDGS